MPQSITLVRGSTSITTNPAAFTTILTAPASCIAARVIIAGLSVVGGPQGGTNLFGSGARGMLTHTTSSSGVASPVFWLTMSASSVQTVSMAFVDGGANQTFITSGTPSCAFIINTNNSYVPINSSSGAYLSTAPTITGNNIKNIWLGPSDTLAFGIQCNSSSSATLQYMFIVIAES
jgi:hypothetical protein